MELLRLKCSSCNSTHAILTMDMIPFCIYSLQAVLALISLCMQDGGSVPKTEEKTGVSYQLIYRFLTIFHEYRQPLLLFLRISRLWEDSMAPMARSILSFLHHQPLPWPQADFFGIIHMPLFLHRRNTVIYPLIFGSRLPRHGLPT